MSTKPKDARSRIYWREQGGVKRAYLNVRDYADVGGRQEALIPKGATRATSDPLVAEQLAAERLRALHDLRRGKQLMGLDPTIEFRPYADRHIRLMEESKEFSESWLDNSARMLDRAADYFETVQPTEHPDEWKRRKIPGSPRNLGTISVPDVQGFVRWLQRQPNGRRGADGTPATYGPQSVRHHLSALSKLFERAIAEGKIKMGENPVGNLMDRPSIPRSATEHLEADELALLLESARTYQPYAETHGGKGGRHPLSCVYELLATHILTGAR